MVTFLDFIDYCVNKNVTSEVNKKYIQTPGIVDTAINYVNLITSSAGLNLYDEDDRYTAINHIFAAGAYTADWISKGTDLNTISQELASTDALLLIMICSRVDRGGVDAMSTCIEGMATDWVNQTSSTAEMPLRIANMLVGTFLLGVMTYMKYYTIP